jgi:putative tricarboxylic transport membrane protein
MSAGKIRIRNPQDAAAGLFLIILSVIAIWQIADLPMGTLRQLGPGMLPRVLAYAVGLCGVTILLHALWSDGARLERWSLRGPLFVLGAVIVFGLTVRPLGLAVAGPLVVVIGGLASRETRLVELAVFAAVITAFCLFLFKFVLSLPIPVAPWLLDY